ncbi:unnamed protein product [Protopolystoma xenopodis]|uniref:Uncharacterized protein n=1 Tax=Protopolystoma xenopodis TaxID=117903 RepID=A0A448WE54_9PLAT|nr:unnamed protein product [Protopolystoma xenopodis]
MSRLFYFLLTTCCTRVHLSCFFFFFTACLVYEKAVQHERTPSRNAAHVHPMDSLNNRRDFSSPDTMLKQAPWASFLALDQKSFGRWPLPLGESEQSKWSFNSDRARETRLQQPSPAGHQQRPRLDSRHHFRTTKNKKIVPQSLLPMLPKKTTSTCQRRQFHQFDEYVALNEATCHLHCRDVQPDNLLPLTWRHFERNNPPQTIIPQTTSSLGPFLMVARNRYK